MIAICGSPILFSIGGMFWKPSRRFILPIMLGILLILGGVPALSAIAATICLAAALCLPYGDRTPYWLKSIVFYTYFIPFAWIGFSWWMVIGPIVIFGLFWISNTNWGKNIVFWRVWEFCVGGLIGITTASFIK